MQFLFFLTPNRRVVEFRSRTKTKQSPAEDDKLPDGENITSAAETRRFSSGSVFPSFPASHAHGPCLCFAAARSLLLLFLCLLNSLN